MGDEALYRQFPWLRATEMRTRVLDAAKLFLDTINTGSKGGEKPLPESEQRKIRAGKEVLGSFGQERGAPTRVDRTHLQALLQRSPMPEVENVYARIERALPEKSLLVIDSLEGVTHKYGLEMEEFVMALQKDLVVGVQHGRRDDPREARGRRDRVSRGRPHLDQPRGAGRAAHPPPAPRKAPGDEHRSGPVRGHVERRPVRSAGHDGPDPQPPADGSVEAAHGPGAVLLDGDPGLRHAARRRVPTGSFNAFEVDVNVGIDDYYMLFTPTFLNFLSQGRGIIAVLAAGESPDKLRETLVRHVPANVFDTRVRIPDYAANETEEPYILPMARYGRDEALRAMVTAEKAVGGPDRKPFIEYTAFDTFESLMGDQVAIRLYFQGVSRAKHVGNLGIGLLKPGLLVSSEILNMMDTYFRVINIDNAPCIYGIRPRTTLYAISPVPEKGAPHAILTPVV